MTTSKIEIERKVRQRAQFTCQKCKIVIDCQYAHIIPESHRGKYEGNNLLFLCYSCHKKFEVAQLDSKSHLYKLLTNEMKAIQKSSHIVDEIRNTFEFFSDRSVIKLGNEGVIIENTPTAISTIGKTSNLEIPLLQLKIVNNQLLLSGFFFDEDNNLVLEIYDNKYITRSSLIWDIEIKIRSYLHIISKDKKMELKIKQNEDSSITLLGILFYLGKKLIITNSYVKYGNGIMSKVTISNSHGGFII